MLNRIDIEKLIRDFIMSKLSHYIEPTRMGTSWGEQIGLSKRKYHATLMCSLSKNRQKDIAKKIGVSHSLLLKWRTEELFRDTMVSNKIEFLTLFVREADPTDSIYKVLDCFLPIKSLSQNDLVRLLYKKSFYPKN